MKRTTVPMLCFALCLLVLPGSQPGSAEETAVAVAQLPTASKQDTAPVVVLKDGTRVAAQKVTRTPTTLKLQLGDGQTRIYRLDDVDLDASVGVPPQVRLSRAKPRANGPARRSSLGAATRTTSLQLPEANAPSDADITIVSSRQQENGEQVDEEQETASFETSDDPTEVGSEVPEPLRTAVTRVSKAWQDCQNAMTTARARCSGNFLGRAYCGKKGVVGAHHTAPCTDAISQAQTKLRTVEQHYDEVWTVARRSGSSPGATRALLAKAGLSDTRQRAASYRASLEAITADNRSEPE